VTKRKVNGYIARQELTSINQALERGQRATRELIYDNPGPVRQGNLLAQVALVFVEIARAVRTLENIITRNNE
jgi:hypothetical protein